MTLNHLKTTSRTLIAGGLMASLLATSAFVAPLPGQDNGDHGNGAPSHDAQAPQGHQPNNRQPSPTITARHDAPADHHNDRESHDNRNDHNDHDRGRDHGRYDDHHDDHHEDRHIVVNYNNGPYYHSQRYIPAPVIYRRDPVHYYPRYYSSAYYSQRYVPIEPDYDYVEVRCTNQPITGTIVGGATGALIGNLVGRGHGRTGYTIGGALLGAIIGQQIDQADESCAYQALEYAQPNTQVTWVNPEDNNSYVVTPGPVTQEDGRYCREYQAKVLVGNQVQDGYGRACRQPDGSWEIIN